MLLMVIISLSYVVLKSALLQLCRKLHISFYHIKSFVILPFQIDHIPMGYSPCPLIGKHLLKITPFCGF